MRLTAGIILPVLLLGVSQVGAQPSQPGPAPASPAGVQCLSRPFTDANGASRPLTIHVPATEAAVYTPKGFAAGACGAQSLEEYRAMICQLALQGNEAVQRRFEQVLGARPRDLCDSVGRAAPFPTAAASPGP